MKLKELNKLINQKWLKPTKKNIKIGAVIRYKAADENRYCRIIDIGSGIVVGIFTNNVTEVDKINSSHGGTSISSIDGVLNETI
jgi:hypothetical protein